MPKHFPLGEHKHRRWEAKGLQPPKLGRNLFYSGKCLLIEQWEIWATFLPALQLYMIFQVENIQPPKFNILLHPWGEGAFWPFDQLLLLKKRSQKKLRPTLLQHGQLFVQLPCNFKNIGAWCSPHLKDTLLIFCLKSVMKPLRFVRYSAIDFLQSSWGQKGLPFFWHVMIKVQIVARLSIRRKKHYKSWRANVLSGTLTGKAGWLSFIAKRHLTWNFEKEGVFTPLPPMFMALRRARNICINSLQIAQI